MRARLELEMRPQPDDWTCGPTCLQAVYRFYEDDMPLDQLIGEIRQLDEGGTLAVLLAEHALRRGYTATIYTYNLHIFDPSWFHEGGADIADRLRRQAEAKDDARIKFATEGYIEFLELGGRLRFDDLTPNLLRRHLKRGQPILTGLSATYLYHCTRERPSDSEYDDVRGLPVGHFVVIYGYETRPPRAIIADPLQDNPAFATHTYSVPMERLVGAILLGVLTHDANLLVIEPRGQRRRKSV